MLGAAIGILILGSGHTHSGRTQAETEMLSTKARFMATTLVKQDFKSSPELVARAQLLKKKPALQVLEKGNTNDKICALTFDDGPYPGHTEKILNILDQFNIKATFFMIGSRVDDNPELAREVFRRGHELGNHTYFHPNLTWLDGPQIQAELLATSWTLLRHTGQQVTLARPPGGQMNPLVKSTIANLGYTTVLWTANPGDLNGATRDTIVKTFKTKLRPGFVYILHDYPSETHSALPEIISYAKAKGYRFVKAGDLLPQTTTGIAARK